MKIIEDKLLEMPWENINNKTFDLEFERKSGEEIIEFLKDLINGKEISNDRGQRTKVTNIEDKIKIINDIRNNNTYMGFIKNKLTSNELKLLDIIFNL
jgi:hypothetical protein